MKVGQQVVHPEFVPVSLTFETRDELGTFVKLQGRFTPDLTGLTHSAWAALKDQYDAPANF